MDQLPELPKIVLKQEQIVEQLSQIVKDHEKRLRSLEKWLSIAMGASLLATWIINLIKKP